MKKWKERAAEAKKKFDKSEEKAKNEILEKQAKFKA